jgi:hypothetical protein
MSTHQGTGSKEVGAKDMAPANRPERSHTDVGERRKNSRIPDEQRSGQGSMTALARLRMLERRRADDKVTRGRDEAN